MAEQWHAVFLTATGELLSVGTEIADPLPVGLAVNVLSGPPDTAAQHWDPVAHTFVPRPTPTDDAILAANPRRPRLTPTAAAGKAALRDFLDDAIREAQEWEWFNAKIQADTIPPAAKAAIASLATGAYQRAKGAALAWFQAT